MLVYLYHNVHSHNWYSLQSVLEYKGSGETLACKVAGELF